jgi:Holliday junction resolvase RusA-like endonuclease
MIKIVLNGAPKGKGRPRFAGKGRPPVTPAATRRYESHLKAMARMEMGGRPPFEGPIELTVNAYMPIPASWPKYKKERARGENPWHISKPDMDNIKKMTDALNDVVWKDDSQVCRDGGSIKVYSDNPRLELIIREIA